MKTKEEYIAEEVQKLEERMSMVLDSELREDLTESEIIDAEKIRKEYTDRMTCRIEKIKNTSDEEYADILESDSSYSSFLSEYNLTIDDIENMSDEEFLQVFGITEEEYRQDIE